MFTDESQMDPKAYITTVASKRKVSTSQGVK